MNVCEAAGFLFVLPLLLAVLLRDLIQRRFDLLFLALVAFALLAVIFMIAGVPMWLAKLSGWSYVYATRANLVVGVASIMALVRYFSRDDSAVPRISFRGEILLFIAIAVLLFGLFCIVNIRLAHFVHFSGVCFAAAFFALVFVCLWTRRTGPAWALLLAPTLYVNALINPIERGLPGFTQNEAWHWLRENQRADPHAKWLVLAPPGHSRNLAEFVKATGADVLGGMRCMPDRKVMQLLDSSNKNVKVYDRFALAWFVPGTGPEPAFHLTFVNSYEISFPSRATSSSDWACITFWRSICPKSRLISPDSKWLANEAVACCSCATADEQNTSTVRHRASSHVVWPAQHLYRRDACVGQSRRHRRGRRTVLRVLFKSDRQKHPGADEVIANGETDWRKVVEQLTGPIPSGKKIFFQKQMTHHQLPEVDRRWLGALTNCFLIRDPAEVITSYIKKNDDPTVEDLGFVQQAEIFDWVSQKTVATVPPVIDAKDVLQNPERMLRLLCQAVGVEFDDAMLSWPPGLRETDGVWAKHWYGEVARSTSFQPYQSEERTGAGTLARNSRSLPRML